MSYLYVVSLEGPFLGRVVVGNHRGAGAIQDPAAARATVCDNNAVFRIGSYINVVTRISAEPVSNDNRIVRRSVQVNAVGPGVCDITVGDVSPRAIAVDLIAVDGIIHYAVFNGPDRRRRVYFKNAVVRHKTINELI